MSTNAARVHDFAADPPRHFNTICPPLTDRVLFESQASHGGGGKDRGLCQDTADHQLSLLVDRSLALSRSTVANSKLNLLLL